MDTRIRFHDCERRKDDGSSPGTVDKEGKKKSNLSMDSEYVMTEDGPKWHEQADAVVKYVLENQSLDGLINEDGYTDTVASVSINLYGFVGGVEDCLRQSSKTVPRRLPQVR